MMVIANQYIKKDEGSNNQSYKNTKINQTTCFFLAINLKIAYSTTYISNNPMHSYNSTASFHS
jgi:hypothetical protein